ncbi:MAG TPA: hypothetical protein VFG45_08900 [Candidatus Nitrosocosmicus sp.]|nr:hypothetical protein [Candidatus Nitrosocosmicus sp.]
MNNSKTFQPPIFVLTSIAGLSALLFMSALVVSVNAAQTPQPPPKVCTIYVGDGPGKIIVPCPPPPPPKKGAMIVPDDGNNPPTVSDGGTVSTEDPPQQKPFIGLSNVQPLEQDSQDQGEFEEEGNLL